MVEKEDQNNMAKLTLENHKECPKCHNNTLPIIPKDSLATARCCQNPDCLAIIDKAGDVLAYRVVKISKEGEDDFCYKVIPST